MITVHGLLGTPDDRLRAAASGADWVVAGTRQLDALAVPAERRIVLGALSTAVAEVVALPAEADVLVVASGDPGYFGVLRALRRHGLRPQVVPAVSSIASAFAAVGLPWDDAAVVSVHGRPLEPALRLARDCAKVAVFTSAEHGIRELAAGLSDLERHWVLAERLGEPDQRVRLLDSAQARQVEPVEPNVVLILDRPPAAADPAWAGVIAEPSLADSAADAATSAAAHPSEPVIGQVTSGLASQARADRVDAILGVTTRRYTSGAVAGLPQAWAECDLVISHLALGATTRLIAPLLQSKLTDPGVVVLDEAGRFAIPLVGGHTGGANDLARRLADGLDATAVLTTATDAVGLPGLDTLGWPWSGAVAEVTRAILDERPVRLVRSQPWLLPALPPNVTVQTGEAADAPTPNDADVAGLILVTDRLTEPSALPTVVLNPPSLVAGLGCNAGTESSALRALLTESLTEAGLALTSVAALTTVDAKADEPGLVALAAELGVPLVAYPAPTLAAQDVPNPSEAPLRAVGTPSVAEASVLAHGAMLIVEKQRTPQATCAIGRLPARGKLTVVGLGPGSRDLTTPRAQAAIREASVVVGYRPYVAQVKDLLAPGVRIASTPMGKEAERTATAIELARQGNKVALVCSGDPAIYAMASPTLEQGTDGIDVEIVPGVTASLAASAILGAPLGHDHATISLSDLHTDWDTILRRLRAAAEADLVTVLYNPRSRTRLHHLPDAVAIFAARRPGTTPIAVVEEADRPDQRVTLSTIAEFDPSVVNMNSLVVIGSSTTRYLPTGVGGTAMVTPRDYHWMNR
ncbi:precorrin-6Y C5,15-methyltransferase (decarboxylating) [Propionicimonas paludicola]|uniref:Precorrin-6Y C5,15-methyltransferase (Decarboxylating) n=1 Tax=Propionicimonas paludicola TaxID=185243 RepID=A0A2A9CWE6_9ACTN|nr:precorrin-3B C(17)-methyltransferase [Propionicimonas paludicola]PFG17899.1 precorrin-6Y C5,15-methyltransferase (decarboxylating) [Propionicimonas paludicola]